MNTAQHIADWITRNITDHPALDGVQIIAAGDDDQISPPSITVTETSSEIYQQSGLTLYGIKSTELLVRLETIPTDDETSTDQHYAMAENLWNIIGNIDGVKSFANDQIFDYVPSQPVTSAEDGNRVSSYKITLISK